ncbi:MAG: VWA domain-containing protein [Fimbriimonadaceae bacterium]|nr:VWA domain-containing protein [Fimbriimonadaceae bacterium]
MNPHDPNRTLMAGADPQRTMAMPAGVAPGIDPNRTAAFTPPKQDLTFRLTPSRTATLANGPAREQFLLEIEAPADAGLPGAFVQGARTPVNLCLLVDRSGSMEGPPLEYAKQACMLVVDLLGPNDVLSIVVFDELVEVLMAPQKVTSREQIKSGIAQLQPGYTTNLSEGLNLAVRQLSQAMDPGRATRLVVLTDGDPTAGVKDFSSLVQMAADVRAQGITATFLGFGPDYNAELLAALARRAGGNHHYISRPDEIPAVFRDELDKVTGATMTSAKLTLETARWVELRGMTGQSVAPGQKRVEMELADLERGRTLQVVFDFEFPNHPLGHYRVAHGRIDYTHPVTGSVDSLELDLIMEFTADQARCSVPPDPKVAAAFEVSSITRQVEKTMLGLKTQALTQGAALQDLAKTQALLVQQGRTAEAQEVTLAMQAVQRGDLGGAEKTLMGAVVNLDQGKTR